MSFNNKGKKDIDIIKEVFNAREGVISATLIMQEDNYYPPAIKMIMDNVIRAINNMQRWALRNPSALEDFNNAIAFCDGDVEPITYSKGNKKHNSSIA